MKAFVYSGDELELLSAMDRSGCVLTDDGKFYCDLKDDDFSVSNSRLPARIKGSYEPVASGWKIAYRVVPAPKTALIAAIFAVLFCASIAAFAVTGGSLTGSALFGILCCAVAVNYAVQYKGCEKRFENLFNK